MGEAQWKPGLLDWIEYLPRGARKAWCEMSGGHDDLMQQAWCDHERPYAIRMYCLRCGRETKWHYPERRPAPEVQR